MKDYNYNENREEQSAREIGKKFAELGFGTVMTDEEYARSEKRIEKSEKRYKFFGSVWEYESFSVNSYQAVGLLW